jgi:hypothetical protein
MKLRLPWHLLMRVDKLPLKTFEVRARNKCSVMSWNAATGVPLPECTRALDDC